MHNRRTIVAQSIEQSIKQRLLIDIAISQVDITVFDFVYIEIK